MIKINHALGLVLAAAVSAFAPTVSAQTLAGQNVDVTVVLTSQCRKATGTPATLTVDFGTYEAFQAGPLVPASPPTLNIECTRGYAPAATVAWDGTTALGTVAGLQYTLSVTAGTIVPGTAATIATTGSGDTVPYVISGSMPAGQAGTDTNAGTANAAATVTRVLTLTF